MCFPNNFIKGIPNEECMVKDGSIATHLFYFKESSDREDENLEQSINWEDDNETLNFTLNQKKDDGNFQFQSGLARVPIEEIKQLNNKPTVNNVISYERDILDNNPYHGNLLIPSNVPKPTRRKLAAGIALCVSDIISRP